MDATQIAKYKARITSLRDQKSRLEGEKAAEEKALEEIKAKIKAEGFTDAKAFAAAIAALETEEVTLVAELDALLEGVTS